MADPELLAIPALLISISHFPATARPQSGLSFAPIVYEVSITEGASRFLAVFYGEWPAPETPPHGDCTIRSGASDLAGTLLGKRVWFDVDADGEQDVGEEGVGGVCVRLYDLSGTLVAETSTDSNGYYGFGIGPGQYAVEVVRPAWAGFSPVGAVETALDSDVDPVTGRLSIELRSDHLTADAGLTGTVAAADQPGVLPAGRVGPIRSGRLVYGHIAEGFQDSCLIFAGASPQVMSELPVCYQVFHQLEGGGYMIDIAEMRQVARQNARAARSDFDYQSNVFDPQPAEGGAPASRLDVYFAYLNQSAWQYDPLYQAYLRFVDTSSYDEAGILHPDVDRLTGRQMHVENLIVLFARHDVISPSNLDIRLDPGRSGPAVLFRDGMSYRIRWNTFGADRDDARPMQFTDEDNRPFPLKSGHTWVIVATLASSLEDGGSGAYRLNFVPPEGAD